ncbi:GNAT family N-acetyltransferase [Georgenia deserti]|uniref:GNAT family N-acetyltransferase n=1 Tax=Georgenia deserti TaxID=2093781 RepID=UPI0036DAC292
MFEASAGLLTDRLKLVPVSVRDIDQQFALHSDPRVWTHFPSGRHVDQRQTLKQLTSFAADWERDGLGYWNAHRRDNGAFVGIGGVRLRHGGIWNLYYRVAPGQQRQGFAVEISRAAVDTAAQIHPEAPVTAYLLEHNHASRATAERVGLSLVWRGPDAGNPDADAVRLVYADRPLTDAQLEID